MDTRTTPDLDYRAFDEAHRATLVRALTRVTRCPLEAEELAHEALTALWMRWDRLEHVLDLEGYLYRTAMNAFRKRCRRRAPEPVLDEGTDPAETVELSQAVRSALAALPTQQRRAAVLVDMLGYGAADAGVLLGMEASTVRVHLTRSRRRLRAALQADYGSAQRAASPRSKKLIATSAA